MSIRPTAEAYEKVPTVIFADSAAAARTLAREVRELIETRGSEGRATVLGMATGSTPVPFYRELIRLHKEEGLSFKNVITFNLDEYYGLDAKHPESYARFMAEQIDQRPTESWKAGQTAAQVERVWRIRWSDRAASITPSDRLNCDGREFQIIGVTEIGRRIGIQIVGIAYSEEGLNT